MKVCCCSKYEVEINGATISARSDTPYKKGDIVLVLNADNKYTIQSKIGEQKSSKTLRLGG
ncbi:hypothetical protein MCHI_002784 [Candidatus Magnetoovum chiemensis]|nr:hypothetical protein MCHI_002784 [Candidatus Magnetoovum chiemensis]